MIFCLNDAAYLRVYFSCALNNLLRQLMAIATICYLLKLEGAGQDTSDFNWFCALLVIIFILIIIHLEIVKNPTTNFGLWISWSAIKNFCYWIIMAEQFYLLVAACSILLGVCFSFFNIVDIKNCVTDKDIIFLIFFENYVCNVINSNLRVVWNFWKAFTCERGQLK